MYERVVYLLNAQTSLEAKKNYLYLFIYLLIIFILKILIFSLC